MTWANAVLETATLNGYEFAALPNRYQALQIFENSVLVTQLGLPADNAYWTSEESGELNVWTLDTPYESFGETDKTEVAYALPVRVVNFYGLPLINSEYGIDGLVYDVVAETRMVHIVAGTGVYTTDTWDNSMALFPMEISNTFTSMPTRAQALKIFRNSYLVTLAYLPLDNNYWTSEDVNETNAYSYDVGLGVIGSDLKTELLYALPVRSEVVPES